MKKLFSIFTAFFAFFATKAEHFDRSLTSTFDNIHRKVAEGLEHFDENYEDLEDYEAENLETEYFQEVEHYRKKGLNQGQAMASAKNSMINRHGSRKFNSAMNKQAKKKAGLVQDVRSSGKLQASFDIVITRNSNNLSENLPVPLFGVAHAQSNYKQIVSGSLPAGISISGIVTNAQGDYVISYTDGTLTDTITIHCNQTPYATFLFATATDTIRMYKNRYTITDTAVQGCYDQEYLVVKKSLFGRKEEETVTINTFKNPSQFQNGIIDIDAEASIDKDRAIVHTIIKHTGSYSVQMSFFVDRYFKLNSASTL